MDSYAQDLRCLFNRAYLRAQQGTREAKDFEKSVLSYQFVARLRQEMRMKLAGMEGSFEQLPTRARSEEAKLKELGGPTQPPRNPPAPKEASGEKKSATHSAAKEQAP